MTLRISLLEGVLCFKHARRCRGSKGKSNGRMRKRRLPDCPSIFISAPQWVDLTNAVTSSINAPPNGSISL